MGSTSYCGTDFRFDGYDSTNLQLNYIGNGDLEISCESVLCVGSNSLNITAGFYYSNFLVDQLWFIASVTISYTPTLANLWQLYDMSLN